MGYLPTGIGIGWRGAAFCCALLLVAGCDETGGFNPFKPQPESAEDGVAAKSSAKMIERDVEAPDVFESKGKGLWDGRPSLGGVWVAHPDVGEPQRVIIRNTENSKSVVGALFRRERDNPGPLLQVSSDAAAALGMLAGAPAELSVIALKREEVPDPEAAVAAGAEAAPTEGLDDAGDIETTALEPVAGAAGAAAAIDAAEEEQEASSQTITDPEPAPEVSNIRKPFVQVGIFSIEENAKDAAERMRQAGMVPAVKEQETAGKKLWRVLVGPAATRSERTSLLKKIKGAGFGDAYPVSN